MDFYIDIGFAVLLRILRDRRERDKWAKAFIKLHDAIENAFPDFWTKPADTEPRKAA